MTRRLFCRLALCLLPSLSACSPDRHSADKIVTAEGQDSIQTLRHDGVDYAFRLYIPERALTEPRPLVVALHGGGVDADSMDQLTHLMDEAQAEQFIYLRPEGYTDLLFQTWNAGACCGRAAGQQVDHVGMIDALLDTVASEVQVDSRRIFVTGHSNGGMMAYRLACELSDRIAAIAVNAAYLMDTDLSMLVAPRQVFSCQPSRPVPVLHMHGLADTCAPFAGGRSLGPQGGIRPPVQDSINTFVANNRCNSTPHQRYANEDALCIVYDGCEDNADVELCVITSAGHVWPGSADLGAEGICHGNTTDALDANSKLWAFFQAHPMP